MRMIFDTLRKRRQIESKGYKKGVKDERKRLAEKVREAEAEKLKYIQALEAFELEKEEAVKEINKLRESATSIRDKLRELFIREKSLKQNIQNRMKDIISDATTVWDFFEKQLNNRSGQFESVDVESIDNNLSVIKNKKIK